MSESHTDAKVLYTNPGQLWGNFHGRMQKCTEKHRSACTIFSGALEENHSNWTLLYNYGSYKARDFIILSPSSH